GLGHQPVMLRPDGQPAADLREDLGGIPPCPGRVVQPAGEAMAAGLGQVGGQAERVVGGVERPVPVRREWPLLSGGPRPPTGTGRTGWARGLTPASVRSSPSPRAGDPTPAGA
ncbi:MAG: hypothetical protein JO252_14010, partial [Planctomycetaceae bacterium]|nr:hypothetical protein [Planctomycetaceae bacterium]